MTIFKIGDVVMDVTGHIYTVVAADSNAFEVEWNGHNYSYQQGSGHSFTLQPPSGVTLITMPGAYGIIPVVSDVDCTCPTLLAGHHSGCSYVERKQA